MALNMEFFMSQMSILHSAINLTNCTTKCNSILAKVNELAGHTSNLQGIARQEHIALLQRLLLEELEALARRADVQQLDRQISVLTRTLIDQGAGQRSFFERLPDAIDATNAVLSNRPAGSYNITEGGLPLDQLYGLMHALHVNNIAWHKHSEQFHVAADNTLGQILKILSKDTPEPDPKWPDIQNQLKELTSSAQHTATTCDTIGRRLHEIEKSLTERDITGRLLEIKDSLSKVEQMLVTIQPSATPDTPKLQPYRAQHADHICRSYGQLESSGTLVHLPMDLTDRPRSSSLRLRYTLASDPTLTRLNFILTDGDTLLLARSVVTPHLLTDLPGDALHLLHTFCPKFLYKLPRCD